MIEGGLLAFYNEKSRSAIKKSPDAIWEISTHIFSSHCRSLSVPVNYMEK